MKVCMNVIESCLCYCYVCMDLVIIEQTFTQLVVFYSTLSDIPRSRNIYTVDKYHHLKAYEGILVGLPGLPESNNIKKWCRKLILSYV